MATWNSITNKHEVVIVVPNSQIPTSVSW